MKGRRYPTVGVLVVAFGLSAVFGPASAADSASGEPPLTKLVGHAVLPARTWLDGPPSGEFDNEGGRFEAPRFDGQPVQGFSSIRWLERPHRILVLSDNGFGGRANSPDYLLRVYRMSIDAGSPADERSSSIDVEGFIQLDDRDGHVPFRLVNENSPDRLLTGGDFDPESLVVAPDGSLWIGEEFGPFLLHFGADGTLLEPPYPLAVWENRYLIRTFRSPQNPVLLARGAAPEVAALAVVQDSGGFEGLAFNADGMRLLAMLEKVVLGDPYRTVRIFEFDLESRQFTGDVHLYRLSGDRHRIGELTHVAGSTYLVVERDDADGERARFKKVFRFDLERTQPIGVVEKTEIADLLHIEDPHRLASEVGSFDFPFITTESVEVVDPWTLLIANDNNFDARGSRGEGLINDNELIWIRLEQKLDSALNPMP